MENFYQNNIQAGSNPNPALNNTSDSMAIETGSQQINQSAVNLETTNTQRRDSNCNFVEKYRIRTLDEMIDNEVAIKMLKSELRYNLIQNVKIFHGPPSSGKSSAALIYAKYLNCQSPLDIGVPCEQCSSCKAAAARANPDIIILNAGSNNGVDTVRDIIEEELRNQPLYNIKVFILEEWHKMTSNALTALLTIMEDPTISSLTAKSSHYTFVMPSTDLPANIAENATLSRALIVPFSPISKEKLVNRLQEICKLENISFEDGTLETLYNCSNGAMRDCLKNLQSLAAYSDYHITEKATKEFFSVTSSDLGKDLFNAIHSLNPIKISYIIENHCNKNILKESDFNDLSNLFLEACNNSTPFMQKVYIKCLRIIRDNRIVFLRDPSRKTDENLIIACSEIITILRDNLGPAICHLTKQLSVDFGELLLTLNPNVRVENGQVIFILDPPKIGLLDFLNKINSPQMNSIFNVFGISKFELKSIGRDICYKIATDFDRNFGELLLYLNPITLLDSNNILTLVIDRPTSYSNGNPIDQNHFESFLYSKEVGDIFISNGVTGFLYR